MSGEHECVFPEEREPSGRLILAPCLVCEVSALDALDQVRRERDAARVDVEARVRAQVEAEILCGENWTPRGPLSCYGCPVCADTWESEATCTHWPAIQWAARIARGAL